MWTPLVRTGGDFLTSALSGESLLGSIFKASGKINMIGLAPRGPLSTVAAPLASRGCRASSEYGRLECGADFKGLV